MGVLQNGGAGQRQQQVEMGRPVPALSSRRFGSRHLAQRQQSCPKSHEPVRSRARFPVAPCRLEFPRLEGGTLPAPWFNHRFSLVSFSACRTFVLFVSDRPGNRRRRGGRGARHPFRTRRFSPCFSAGSDRKRGFPEPWARNAPVPACRRVDRKSRQWSIRRSHGRKSAGSGSLPEPECQPQRTRVARERGCERGRTQLYRAGGSGGQSETERVVRSRDPFR